MSSYAARMGNLSAVVSPEHGAYTINFYRARPDQPGLAASTTLASLQTDHTVWRQASIDVARALLVGRAQVEAVLIHAIEGYRGDITLPGQLDGVA